MAPGALDCNAEARAIVLTMIETGCRPSEICNLQPEDIHLDADVPHITIRFRNGRTLKTESLERAIPLVGVSLAAMRNHPNGFPRYADKEDALSAMLMRHFRTHGLLETDDHYIYSLRHSFEKRMVEAGLSDDFRRMIMGHHVDRPEYGDGGSLTWRREQLRQIELPFDPAIV